MAERSGEQERFNLILKEVERLSAIGGSDTRGLVDGLAKLVWLDDGKDHSREWHWAWAQQILAENVTAYGWSPDTYPSNLRTNIQDKSLRYRTGDEKRDWQLAQEAGALMMYTYFISRESYLIDSSKLPKQ